MRKGTLALGIAVAALCAGCCPFAGSRICAPKAHLGKVRHAVLLKFKDAATTEQIKGIEDGFRALPGKIPGIWAFDWGKNISSEGLTEGYTHCFLVTFDDAAARDAYLPHPAHKAFVEELKPILDKVLVIDYIAQR